MTDTALPENLQGREAERIESDIEKLRLESGDTQELYQEVCALLFFRYGVTPTANKLYQLVRKGSMSAPAQALARFWKTLREKSRTRIEHPDLPKSLCEITGEMAGALWQRAQALAQEGLEAERKEGKVCVLEAQALVEEATHQAKLSQKSLEDSQRQLQSCERRLREVEQLLAKEEGEKIALQRQLQEHIHQHRELQESLQTSQQELERQRATTDAIEARYQNDLKQAFLETERERSLGLRIREELEKAKNSMIEQQHGAQNALRMAREDFLQELEQQRVIATATETRYLKDLERACRDVEHERAQSLKVHEQLEHARSNALEQTKRDRAVIDTLQQERAKLNQKLGELEGALAETRTARDMLRQQLEQQRVPARRRAKKTEQQREQST